MTIRKTARRRYANFHQEHVWELVKNAAEKKDAAFLLFVSASVDANVESTAYQALNAAPKWGAARLLHEKLSIS